MRKFVLGTVVVFTAGLSGALTSTGYAISNQEMLRGERMLYDNLHQVNPAFSFVLPISNPIHYSQETQEALKHFENDIKNNPDEFERMNIHGAGFRVVSRDGKQAAFNFTVNYLASKEQEKAVDSKVNQVLAEIIQPSFNEHQKVKAIHDWIISHVIYDKTYQKYSDYNAAVEGSSVCQGFALLGYKMFTKAGIPAHIVSGTGNGEPHAWNMVQLDGHWYQMDLTWDENYREGGGNPYAFYLKTNQQFEPAHRFDANQYPVADSDYLHFLQEKAKSNPGAKELLDAIGNNRSGSLNPDLLYPSSLHPVEFSEQAIEKETNKVNQGIVQPIVNIVRSDSSILDKLSQVISVIESFLSAL